MIRSMMGGNSSKFSFYLIWSVCRWNNKYIANMEKSMRKYNIYKWSSSSIISSTYIMTMELIPTCIKSRSSIMGNSFRMNIFTSNGSYRCIYRFNIISSNIHKRSKCIDIHSGDDMGRGKQSSVVIG